MPASVPRQKADANMPDLAAQDFIGRLAPRRLNRDPLRIFEGIHGIEPRSPDDADRPIAHEFSSSRIIPTIANGWALRPFVSSPLAVDDVPAHRCQLGQETVLGSERHILFPHSLLEVLDYGIEV